MLVVAVVALAAAAEDTVVAVGPSGEAGPESSAAPALSAASADAGQLSAVFLSAFSSDECERIVEWAHEVAARNASAPSLDAPYAGNGGDPWVSRRYVRADLPWWAMQRVQERIAAADSALWRLGRADDYLEQPIVSSYARGRGRPKPVR